ncbi:MAG: DUF4158 domain-containing protein [Candidatus Endonucleobacter sp. (ex Gigantidas childressi)]|nr:DUF4158 domain-containing protein [Candidatus Endonucleobacter sp. (ex Gigantidas childressi)]
MRASDKNITVLSDAERETLYGLPDFDDFQRAEYFSLTDEERTLAQRRNGIPEQILCMLQIGYLASRFRREAHVANNGIKFLDSIISRFLKI